MPVGGFLGSVVGFKGCLATDFMGWLVCHVCMFSRSQALFGNAYLQALLVGLNRKMCQCRKGKAIETVKELT